MAVALALSACLITAFAADNDSGKPVYVAIYGLNQLNRNCIRACSSSGYVDSVQIWDGGTCIKDGWLIPGHEYTVKVRVNGVNVQLDGNKGLVYINGQYAWGGHYVTAKMTFTTPRYFGYGFYTYYWNFGRNCNLTVRR